MSRVEAAGRPRPTVDDGTPLVLSRPPRPHAAFRQRKEAAVEAAMADIRMIGKIAKEMSRAPSLSVLERRGPTSLNADKRRRELRRIDAENERLLKRLETAKPAYKVRDQKRSYKESRKHVALASVRADLPVPLPQLPRIRSSSQPEGHDGARSPSPETSPEEDHADRPVIGRCLKEQRRRLDRIGKPSQLLPQARAELPLLPRPRGQLLAGMHEGGLGPSRGEGPLNPHRMCRASSPPSTPSSPSSSSSSSSSASPRNVGRAPPRSRSDLQAGRGKPLQGSSPEPRRHLGASKDAPRAGSETPPKRGSPGASQSTGARSTGREGRKRSAGEAAPSPDDSADDHVPSAGSSPQPEARSRAEARGGPVGESGRRGVPRDRAHGGGSAAPSPTLDGSSRRTADAAASPQDAEDGAGDLHTTSVADAASTPGAGSAAASARAAGSPKPRPRSAAAPPATAARRGEPEGGAPAHGSSRGSPQARGHRQPDSPASVASEPSAESRGEEAGPERAQAAAEEVEEEAEGAEEEEEEEEEEKEEEEAAYDDEDFYEDEDFKEEGPDDDEGASSGSEAGGAAGGAEAGADPASLSNGCASPASGGAPQRAPSVRSRGSDCDSASDCSLDVPYQDAEVVSMHDSDCEHA